MNIFQQQKNHLNLLIILFILIIAFSYWVQSLRVADLKPDALKNITDFAQQIKIIDKKIVDLTWSGGLFQYNEFKQIHDNPADYFSVACEALKSSEFTDQQKIIIGHSMHGSDLNQFLSLAKYGLQLLEAGTISSDVFERIVFPTYDWNTSIVESYDENETFQFLEQVLKSNKVSDKRKNIIRERVLTGKGKEYVNKL